MKQDNWGYKQAFIRCVLLFFVGIVCQFLFGPIDNSVLHYPWNLLLLIIYISVLVLTSLLSDKKSILKRFFDRYAYLSAIVSLLILCIIFGLTKQDEFREGIVFYFGFSQMASSWSFNIILLYFTTILGLNCIYELRKTTSHKPHAIIFHILFFIILLSGIFGSGDKERVKINAILGKSVQLTTNDDGTRINFPYSICLDEFIIEQYPPKLVILDSLGICRESLIVEHEGDNSTINNWRLEVCQYFQNAIPIDEVFYESKDKGSSPAVFVRATNQIYGDVKEGWVSSGSYLFNQVSLQLDNSTTIYMPHSEVKHYLSKISTTDKKGHITQHNIEVNHPASLGSWRIYQIGYDSSMGQWSNISVLECVRDPWYMIVKIALWGMILLAIFMLFTIGSNQLKSQKL